MSYEDYIKIPATELDALLMLQEEISIKEEEDTKNMNKKLTRRGR